jgi:hypothetical protein
MTPGLREEPECDKSLRISDIGGHLIKLREQLIGEKSGLRSRGRWNHLRA